jgi:hypothetical protein
LRGFARTEEGGITKGWESKGLSREGKGFDVFRKLYDLALKGESAFILNTENGQMQVVTILHWQ